MVYSMATAVVLLGVGLLLILGAILVGGARERSGPTRRCGRAGCGAINRADARFCSTCGGGFDALPDANQGNGG